MGQRLRDFYYQAELLGGLQAKIRLAILTRTTSTQAESEPDSAPLVQTFQSAMATLEREFGQREGVPSDVRRAAAAPEAAGSAEDRLRRHHQVFLDLMSQRSLFLGDLDRTTARITEAASATLACERVSVWFYDAQRTLIRCADLYERQLRKHSSGVELAARDFPRYFRALEHERTIAAHDAHTDPRTSEFSESYLGPLGITSMLDVPIWAEGKMIGVVCHEHTGPQRTWIGDEESFAFMMAAFVALAVERAR